MVRKAHALHLRIAVYLYSAGSSPSFHVLFGLQEVPNTSNAPLILLFHVGKHTLFHI